MSKMTDQELCIKYYEMFKPKKRLENIFKIMAFFVKRREV